MYFASSDIRVAAIAQIVLQQNRWCSIMMKLLPIPAFRANYIWLLADTSGNALVVDPGDSAPVMEILDKQSLTLRAILVTHHHPDHTAGIKALANHPDVIVYGPASETVPCLDIPVSSENCPDLNSPALRMEVIDTPGHTRGHVSYLVSCEDTSWLFCGDTLFSGGCGRLFEGTPAQMHASLQRLATLPGDVLVCPAHEYTLANLMFAERVLPADSDILERLAEVRSLRDAGKPSLPSSIATECRSNLFLRCGETGLGKALEQHAGHPLHSDTERFAVLRRWKDNG